MENRKGTKAKFAFYVRPLGPRKGGRNADRKKVARNQNAEHSWFLLPSVCLAVLLANAQRSEGPLAAGYRTRQGIRNVICHTIGQIWSRW